jgi:hypothetical protein
LEKARLKEGRSRPNGISGIHKDHVEFPRMLREETLARGDFHVHAGIQKCSLVHGREPFFADLDDLGIDLHQSYLLDGVAEGLAEGAAVSPAHDEDFFRGGVGKERGMHEHLVIKKLVALGEHEPPIQGQNPAVAFRLRQVQDLVRRSPADEPPFDAQAKPQAWRLFLT